MLLEALEDLDVEGVETNRALLISVLGHPDFRARRGHHRLAGARVDAPLMTPVIEFVDTTTRDGNQSLWSATGLTTPDVLAIAPTMDRVGYPRARFHLEHAHGGLGPLPPRGSVGADPARQRGDAEHAAEHHHDRHAVHLVGAGRPRT